MTLVLEATANLAACVAGMVKCFGLNGVFGMTSKISVATDTSLSDVQGDELSVAACAEYPIAYPELAVVQCNAHVEEESMTRRSLLGTNYLLTVENVLHESSLPEMEHILEAQPALDDFLAAFSNAATSDLGIEISVALQEGDDSIILLVESPPEEEKAIDILPIAGGAVVAGGVFAAAAYVLHKRRGSRKNSKHVKHIDSLPGVNKHAVQENPMLELQGLKSQPAV
jgi:hypothetical protein